MRPPITLFEHEYTKGFDWSDREAVQIDAFNKQQGDTILQPAFRKGKRELKATQYVGVVTTAKRTIQILPKIYRKRDHIREDRESIVREATENLLYLLSHAGRFPIRENEITALTRQRSDWFEILTRIFATHLIEEWEKGAVRNYQTVEDRIPVLKGKWMLNRQFRRPASRHMFDVSFDEFSPDNKLNRVFRFVVERLWEMSRDSKNRQMLGDLRFLMEEVALLPAVTVQDASSAVLNRTNSRYAPLLNMARMFLGRSALRLSSGRNDSYAFVFDMNALFESFLVEFIRRHWTSILPEALWDCDLLPQTTGATRYLATHENRNLFRMKPDLAFRGEDDTFPVLLDAKYKKLNREDSRHGVSQSDFYQMHAYSERFDCQNILLVYPQHTDMKKGLHKKFQIKESETVIKVSSIDLNLKLTAASDRRKLIGELRGIFGFETGNHTYGNQE